MIFKFFSEFCHNRDRWQGRRITQRTKRAPEHVLRQVLNVVDVFLNSSTRMKANQRLFQPVGAFTAGNAPSTTFVPVELHDSQSDLHHTSCIVTDDPSPRSKPPPALHQHVKH